ncbi:MAG: MerR family transcriptional regulator [Novosphingobium sp.]|nr:MerR family transcriptional regulator [Novosphingobium sp.]
MDKLFDEKTAARNVGMSPRTLRRWRKSGRIDYYLTPTGRVRYSLDQLLEAVVGSIR